MRYSRFALVRIRRCRLAQRADSDESLPAGVEIATIYDCDQLIDRAMENLVHDVAEEFVVVVVVCSLFL